MTAALILGGGAPNLTLMTGALAALKERGAEFSAISASGAGMLVALLYAAPKDIEPIEALKSTRNMGVVDPINVWFPFNYKVFQKPGILAEWYRKALNPFLNHLPQSSLPEQWANDLAWFVAAMFSPSSLWPLSGGLSAPAPWIEDVVDFKKLEKLPFDLYINAYNLTNKRMDTFKNTEITANHFRAALAFPFIYPPFRLNNCDYIEGSAVDTFNFYALLDEYEIQKKEPIDALVVFDVIGQEEILHAPADLYDAWVQSIMVPLVSMAKDDLKIFKDRHLAKYKPLELRKICFDCERIDWDKVLHWSRSNLENLYDVGYDAGWKFYDENRDILDPRHGGAARANVRALR